MTRSSAWDRRSRSRPRRPGRRAARPGPSSRSSTGARCRRRSPTACSTRSGRSSCDPATSSRPSASSPPMMQVSRPVLREALRALALMNVVDIRQGDGTYITSLEPQQLISHLDFVFSKDRVALVQVIETRRVVEIGNVRLAADADHAGRGRAPRGARRRAARRRRRPRPVQRARHRVPRRGVRRGRQLPARPVHEHHQHAGPGQPGADRRLRATPRARAARPRGDLDALRARTTRTPRRRDDAHLDHVEER